MSQDHSQDTVDRTTVINWQPATVDSASDEVTYTVTSGSDLIMDFDNTTTTATVALPAFNTDYIFCVEAVNVCGATSGASRCATPPVRIEAEGKYLLYRTASLLRPARCYAPPPPYFRAKLGYPITRPPPPRAARAGLRYCSSCMCTRCMYLCIKRVENSWRTGLGLFR